MNCRPLTKLHNTVSYLTTMVGCLFVCVLAHVRACVRALMRVTPAILLLSQVAAVKWLIVEKYANQSAITCTRGQSTDHFHQPATRKNQ